MSATLSANDRRRTRFGKALAEAITDCDYTQTEFGEVLGDVRQSSISGWCSGASLPPDVETVFRIEKLLDLEPGELSRLLGFLPVRNLSVADAVMADNQLDEAGRQIVLSTYREVAAAKKRHPTAHKPAVARSRRSVA